jgi:hypothetical protein
MTEAAAACEAVLHQAPRDWLALRLLAHIRLNEHAFDQAVQLLTSALQAAPPDVPNPDVVSMLNGLAKALRGKQDLAGAFACCRQALARRPRDATTLLNYGNTLRAANRHMEALEQFQLARTVGPDSAEARFDEGVAMLALGLWSDGFQRFEERLSHPSLRGLFPEGVPHWRGETDIAGRTILLHAEQGFGDTIQFVRYVPLVAAYCARVVMRVQPPLHKLLASLPGVAETVSYQDAIPVVDVQCPILSLPFVFRTTLTNLPPPAPYLSTPSKHFMVWQALLGPHRCKRVGLSWRGRMLRSLPLATLAPLLALPDMEFHALKQEMPDGERLWLKASGVVVDHTAELNDFSDTAAVISLMDLVISIDTSVAHLAGALGKPVWIMLPFSADWRWLVGRSDTPWYPTARLFRQKRPGDWTGVVAEVVKALSADVGSL